MDLTYDRPVIVDYGDVVELTATGILGPPNKGGPLGPNMDMHQEPAGNPSNPLGF